MPYDETDGDKKKFITIIWEGASPLPRLHPLTSAITATGRSLWSVVLVVTSVRPK